MVGGLSSEQRVQKIFDYEATVVVCTPTYAQRLALLAEDMGLDLAAGPVATTIHAGEPGASLPSVRDRIETAWGARCWDHAGMSEVGPWGYQCPEDEGLHLLVLFEFLDLLDRVRCIHQDTLDGNDGDLVAGKGDPTALEPSRTPRDEADHEDRPQNRNQGEETTLE